MITSEQLRGARALLRWSAKQLAQESGVSWTTIQRMEASSGVPPGLTKNLVTIQKALEAAGIIFIDEDEHGGPGVRLAKEKD